MADKLRPNKDRYLWTTPEEITKLPVQALGVDRCANNKTDRTRVAIFMNYKCMTIMEIIKAAEIDAKTDLELALIEKINQEIEAGTLFFLDEAPEPIEVDKPDLQLISAHTALKRKVELMYVLLESLNIDRSEADAHLKILEGLSEIYGVN